MSTAIYIATEKKIRGLDPFVNGKAVGHIEDAAMESLCSAAGAKSLLGFISQDPEELADLLEGEDVEEGEVELPAEEWYAPEEGLQLARGLVRYLEQNAGALPNTDAVLEDLREYERVFEKLVEKKVRWHFAVDF